MKNEDGLSNFPSLNPFSNFRTDKLSIYPGLKPFSNFPMFKRSDFPYTHFQTFVFELSNSQSLENQKIGAFSKFADPKV